MPSLKALRMSIAIGVLTMLTNVTPLPMTEEPSIHQIPLLDAQQELPITPSMTLTVCPEGPPTCDFKKIQDAINAAPDPPPVRSWEEKPVIPLIRIAPGTYEENLLIIKSLWLQGAGREQTIVVGQLEGFAQRPTIFVAGSWPIAVGITGLSIAAGNAEAVQMIGRISGVISGNKIVSFGGKGVGGIWLTGALPYVVISNNIIAFSEAGIHLESVSPISEVKPGSLISDPDYGVWIIENEIQSIQNISLPLAGNGIVLHHASGVVITRNHIFNNTLSGVFLGDAQNILVSGNSISGNGFGILAALPPNLDIELLGNHIIANDKGVLIGTGWSIKIESNIISFNRSDGISALKLPYPYPLIEIQSLQGNEIKHNGGYGIDLEPQTTMIVICKDNQVSSNQKGDYSSEELRAKCGA